MVMLTHMAVQTRARWCHHVYMTDDRRVRQGEAEADEFEAWVITTRRKQGLPPRVEDPVVISRIADSMLGGRR